MKQVAAKSRPGRSRARPYILGAQLERFRVEPLRMLPNSTQFCLNCFVEGDQPDQTFPVKIPKTENVGILKDLIKEKKSPDLDHVSASKLKVFLVSESFLIDDLASKQPPTNDTPLRPNKGLSSLFAGDFSEEDLHIWVKAPPGMSSRYSLSNLF